MCVTFIGVAETVVDPNDIYILLHAPVCLVGQVYVQSFKNVNIYMRLHTILQRSHF
jgi:hypothetical protein